jgi:D-alanine-D-alanine ligase
LRIALVYNAPVLSPTDRDYASEAGVLESVAALKSALTQAGHEVVELAAGAKIVRLMERLESLRPDVVVNLCESWGGNSANEPHVAALLEILRLPYTGSPPECLGLARDKVRTKRLLAGAGIATAEFIEILPDEPPPETPLRHWLEAGPVFIKPASEDASLGVSFASVTSDWPALERQVAEIHKKYGAALAERYIAGREFNVGILESPEPRVLPLAEIEFRTGLDLPWPILTYAGKWSPNSTDDLATPVRCPAIVEPDLARSLEQTALSAYRLTGCRDYARIDLRVDPQGQVYVLEVNANPDIGPHAGLARMLRAHGTNYEQFASQLVENAYRRRIGSEDSAIPKPSFQTASDVEIRSLQADDVPILLEFTRASGFFRADEIEVAEELLQESLFDGPAGHYQVLVAVQAQRPVGWSCHGCVPLTDATYDLYWIVVAPNSQRSGVGRRLLSAVERAVHEKTGRWLLAETSSTEKYDSTREFYLRCGYHVLSQIDDFYRPGDGRVIFGKRLDQP